MRALPTRHLLKTLPAAQDAVFGASAARKGNSHSIKETLMDRIEIITVETILVELDLRIE